MEPEFYCFKTESEGPFEALWKLQEAVARLLEEARSLDHDLLFDGKAADLGLAQYTHNLVNLKRALEDLIEKMQASKLKIKESSNQHLGIKKSLQQRQELVVQLEVQQQSLQGKLSLARS